ncbi:MAG TPA: hypothetical protein VIQ00_15715 [Chitinophagaceae bacterium]
MQEEIELRNCKCCQPIDRDETKYQTDIIATSCIWLENIESKYSLQQTPNAGETHYVTLKPPVKFSLNMELWLLYDCPLATYNGYEKEEEIEKARFCYGQISKIVSYNESGATVEFRILKALTLQDILKTKESIELPGFWAEFFNVSIDRDEYVFDTIGKYYILSASAHQGDLGQSCVITKHENELTICLLHEWVVSANGTFAGKYKLPEEIRKQIMTKK